MRTISNILGGIARVSGVTVPSGLPSDIEIPAILSPTVNVIEPLDATVSDAAALQRSTFSFRSRQNSQNAAAIDTLLATMTKGMWRFSIYGTGGGNFNETTLIPTAVLALSYGQVAVDLMMFEAFLNVISTATRVVDIYIPADGAEIRTQLRATGVGQQMIALYDGVVSRLL